MARRKGRLSNDSFAIAPVNFPTGSVLDFAGSTAPDGWLLCYGQAVSRTDYASLFATLGTTYGSGDGSTTFNLPDYRGRVLVGKDNMGGSAAGRMTSLALSIGDGNTLGSSGGSQIHPLATNEVGAHSHSASSANDTHSHNWYISNSYGTRLNSAAATNAGTPGDTGTSSGSATVTTTTDQHNHAITVSSNAASVGHQNTQPSIIANKIIKV
jgi:microcystin-dependent protein